MQTRFLLRPPLVGSRRPSLWLGAAQAGGGAAEVGWRLIHAAAYVAGTFGHSQQGR